MPLYDDTNTRRVFLFFPLMPVVGNRSVYSKRVTGLQEVYGALSGSSTRHRAPCLEGLGLYISRLRSRVDDITLMGLTQRTTSGYVESSTYRRICLSNKINSSSSSICFPGQTSNAKESCPLGQCRRYSDRVVMGYLVSSFSCDAVAESQRPVHNVVIAVPARVAAPWPRPEVSPELMRR